jgi:hypothetical protein
MTANPQLQGFAQNGETDVDVRQVILAYFLPELRMARSWIKGGPISAALSSFSICLAAVPGLHFVRYHRMDGFNQFSIRSVFRSVRSASEISSLG